MDILKKYDQYIKGQLSEEQLESFTKDIVKEQMEAEALKKKWAGLLENDQDFQKLKEEILKEEKPATVKPLAPGRSRHQWLSIAAGLLLLVTVGFFIWQSKGIDVNTLAGNHLKTVFSYQDSRGGVAEGNDLRIEASDFYRANNFVAAAPLFDQLLNSPEGNPTDQFYLGLSHLYSGNYSTAIEKLTTLKGANDFSMQKELSWYLGLALIQEGQLEAAKSELEVLSSGSGWKGAEARELIAAME